MNPKTFSVCFVLSLTGLVLNAQNFALKTNKMEVELSDPKKNVTSFYPRITWLTPENETVFQKEGKLALRLKVESQEPMLKLVINVLDKTPGGKSLRGMLRGTGTLEIDEKSKYMTLVERNLTLLDGINEIEVIVENSKGIRASSTRTVHIGETVLADAAKLDRTDYALIFVTDKYDHWPQLSNPVFDGHALAEKLKKSYGFKVDMVENPSQDQLWAKLREYAGKKYKPLDQIFIFFAGHGHFDNDFKEGYLVTKESLLNDEASYVSHDRLHNNINNIPCEHILLTMDVCFGGTVDDTTASSRGISSVYNDVKQSEFIIRKLTHKTRKYLASGGKEYVSDGIAGHHSPFTLRFLDALDSHGGNDGILSLSELLTYVERLNPEPKFGRFGSDAVGSEFVFVAK